MSDSEAVEGSPGPSAAQCQKAIDAFSAVSNADEALAMFFLQDHNWKVESALEAFFATQKETGTTGGRSLPPSALTTQPPDTFKLLSWNIDGLDQKNATARIAEIAKIIESCAYTVVFLQEVTHYTLRQLEDRLESYNILTAEQPGCDYFTAVLLRCGRIYMDGEPEVIQFPSTSMGRTLHIVRAHIGKAKLVFFNTHLESTMDHSGERIKQLKVCFRSMSDEDRSEVTTLFGGDLNLRDKELDEMSGLPNGVVDLWTATGARPECKYTWDMSRNSNLEMPGRFKPRCRFDRLYMLPSNPPQVCPRHFGLVGIEKVPATQSFPSDHWGIEVLFDILVNKK